MRPEDIKMHPAFEQPWYYTIELAPGLYTPGHERPNVALTRYLLNKIRIDERVRCLDVGIQEGLVSMLMERRGASVVAYDRVYSEERIGLVRAALDAQFELIGQPINNHTEVLWIGRGGPTPGTGLPLPRLPVELTRRAHAPFDVAVFSGVLYHVYDPLASLAIVRGLVRTGGVAIVETAAIFNAHFSLNLNAAGRFTPYSIWMPSLGCLDYLLRLARFEPLDVVYFGRQRGRIAIACRAVEKSPAEPEDEFINSPLHDYELAEYLNWPAVSSDAPAVAYKGDEGRVDIVDAVRSSAPYQPEPEQKRLDLGADA